MRYYAVNMFLFLTVTFLFLFLFLQSGPSETNAALEFSVNSLEVSIPENVNSFHSSLSLVAHHLLID